MWQQFKEKLKEETFQKKISVVLSLTLFALLIIYVFVTALFLLPQRPLFFFSSEAMEFLVLAACGYFAIYVILKQAIFYKKIVGFFLVLIVIVGIATLKMVRRNTPIEELLEYIYGYIGLAFIFSALFFVFRNLNLFLNNSYVKTQLALADAEQKLLRQQLNPHFLFNAFNSLYSLSLKQHHKTPDAILKLSGMMRYVADNTQQALVPLKNELDFISDYIAIEKIRFGENAAISYKFPTETTTIFIPPLLLVTLVENAFKHGFYTNDINAFIEISCIEINQELQFTVKNRKQLQQHFNATKRRGSGLENLKKRLIFQYKNEHTFSVIENETTFKTLLVIPIKDE